MEYDAACAEAWADKTKGATSFPGDQANATFLEEFITKAGGDFDIIVDDGGHTMDQQIVSLEHLWKAVKPGGYYFIEDLQTSYWGAYGGDESPQQTGGMTMVKYLNEIIFDKMIGGKKHVKISNQVRGVAPPGTGPAAY